MTSSSLWPLPKEMVAPQMPQIMGIINLTPDSFSDGGRFRSVDEAVHTAMRMTEEGADLIDVGGESTRPGSRGVSLDEEMSRVLPLVSRLVREGIVVSVDTSKAEVARGALDVGASMINDVTALRDPDMAGVCARAGCKLCVMHMQGEPETMQLEPRYLNVVTEVRQFLLDRVEYAIEAGIHRDHLLIDPGIGFGKTDAHNLALIGHLETFVSTGFPVLLGVSRKGFIGRILNGASVLERQEGTLAIHAWAQWAGVAVFRTHDVFEAKKTAMMSQAIAREALKPKTDHRAEIDLASPK